LEYKRGLLNVKRITSTGTKNNSIEGLAWWFTPVIPATQEVEVEGSWSEIGPEQKHGTIQKITKGKKKKVQVIEHLLEFNPVLPKNINNSTFYWERNVGS
jgi:hypothetical protein